MCFHIIALNHEYKNGRKCNLRRTPSFHIVSRQIFGIAKIEISFVNITFYESDFQLYNALDIILKRSPWHLLASPHKGVKVDISRRVNIVLCRLSVLKQSIVKSNTSFTICPVKKYGSIPKRRAFAWLLKKKKSPPCPGSARPPHTSGDTWWNIWFRSS